MIQKKANNEYIKLHLAIQNKANKQVIAIDDQQINIDSAEQLNIIGIRFQNSRQLKRTLKIHKLKLI